jgi:hypothetical protein
LIGIVSLALFLFFLFALIPTAIYAIGCGEGDYSLGNLNEGTTYTITREKEILYF